MAWFEKLIRKMRQSRRNIRFADGRRILLAMGYEEAQAGGGTSHYRYTHEHPAMLDLTITRPHGNNKHISPGAVAEILEAYDAWSQLEE